MASLFSVLDAYSVTGFVEHLIRYQNSSQKARKELENRTLYNPYIDSLYNPYITPI